MNCKVMALNCSKLQLNSSIRGSNCQWVGSPFSPEGLHYPDVLEHCSAECGGIAPKSVVHALRKVRSSVSAMFGAWSPKSEEHGLCSVRRLLRTLRSMDLCKVWSTKAPQCAEHAIAKCGVWSVHAEQCKNALLRPPYNTP